MLRPLHLCLGVLTLSFVGIESAWGQSKKKDGDFALEHFNRLTPQERRQLVERGDVKAIWHTVAKGEVIPQIVERGTLEAMQVSDVVCRVKEKDTVIKWVVDDGTIVKSGEKILEFDDRAIRDKLKVQKLQVELASAQLEQATRSVALAQREGKLAIREAEADIAAAERELKADAGGDAVKKEALELRVERARVNLERARLTAAKQEFRAQGEQRAKTAVLQQEKSRLESLQEDLHHCVVHAPQDGFLIYYVPEGLRLSAGPGSIVAVGEPVREGQKLLRVADLRRMAMQIRVHESRISQVRKDQAASVRVDAAPKTVFTGAVAWIASAASQADWKARDVKVYPVVIWLDGDNQKLKPGMSAEARIVFERRQDVLWLPIAAVITQGKERYCFVRDGQKELAKRTVNLGAAGELTVEVREGLREGDQVLVNARAFARLVLPKPHN